MGIYANYQCNVCGNEFELHPQGDVVLLVHDHAPGKRCKAKDVHRVWTPVSIGKVAGAGGSPSR